ncbi:MAG: hypothetical protein LAT63_16985 [Marinobacter sp.]|nr:hypothetical protein [Marinobacter sp.]
MQSNDTPWDELELLQDCRRAVCDLIVPCADLHVVDRDALAKLLGYLDRQAAAVIEQIRPARY